MKANLTITRINLFYPLLLLVLFIVGCYPKTTIPIDTLRYETPGRVCRELFIFLPGNGDPLDAFEKNGVVEAVRRRGFAVDMIAVNAHIGYYMDGSFLQRLKEDVVDPAKARGYTKIWFIGNSLGGFGSLSYARQYPEDVSGIVALGPFLGEKMTVHEIWKAGGLRAWDPGDIPDNSKEGWEKHLWKWIKNAQEQKDFWNWVKKCDEPDADCPPGIYLGYGKRDRFSYGQELLAETLPRENVFVIDGGHNWKTWKTAWNLILDRLSLIRSPDRAQARHEP